MYFFAEVRSLKDKESRENSVLYQILKGNEGSILECRQAISQKSRGLDKVTTRYVIDPQEAAQPVLGIPVLGRIDGIKGEGEGLHVKPVHCHSLDLR